MSYIANSLGTLAAAFSHSLNDFLFSIIVENPNLFNAEDIVSQVFGKGFCVVNNFLNKGESGELRLLLNKKHDSGDFKKAGMGKLGLGVQKISEIRGDYILWMDELSENITERLYLDKILALSQAVNLSGKAQVDYFDAHYAKYPIGTHYLPHKDRFKNDWRRKLSVVVYLNFEWKEENGGHLLLHPEGLEGPAIKILPESGLAVVFDSGMLHEVQKSARERDSIACWLVGPDVE